MRLRFWRRREQPTTQPSEATLSRQRAEARLEQTMRETAYYEALGKSLRELREANHLTELFFTNRHNPRGQE